MLGDLKSGYLNSFGVFLSQDFNSQQREKLRACQTLEGLKDLVGPTIFDAKLQAFDELNQGFIDLYLHHCEFIEKHQGLAQLAQDLKSLPTPLYWRKAK